jgi:hypothetical protein
MSHHRPQQNTTEFCYTQHNFHYQGHFTTMVLLCYSCLKKCKNEMGLLQHLKSCPGCLEELGISPSLNWAELLGLPTSSSSGTASLPINEHPIHVQPDLKLAAKCPVEYMWKEEDSAFPSMPDAPTKRLKHRPTATEGNQTSQITIEHRCG